MTFLVAVSASWFLTVPGPSAFKVSNKALPGVGFLLCFVSV